MQLEPLLLLADGVVASFWTLLLAGLLGGLTAGLFGVGGGVIVTPLLISIGIPPRIAAGSMNVAIISNAADALVHDLPRHKVDWKLGLMMGAAAVVGGQLGTIGIGALGKPALLDQLIRGGFLILLTLLAWRLLRKHGGPSASARRFLTNWPLKYTCPYEAQPVSPLLPMLVALAGGVVAALLGVGGGILYVPMLLGLFHRPMQDLVPVSQIAVLMGSISVSTGHVLHTGNLDARLVLILVLAGSVGTVVGSRLRIHLESRLLERLLAFVLILAALRLALQGLGALWSPADVPLEPALGGRNWLAGFNAWCLASPWQAWLGTVGLAIVLTPPISWLQHSLLDRLRKQDPS